VEFSLELCRERYKDRKQKQLPRFNALQIGSGKWTCTIEFEGKITDPGQSFFDRREAEEAAAEKLLRELVREPLD
jgi:hypothetical protein